MIQGSIWGYANVAQSKFGCKVQGKLNAYFSLESWFLFIYLGAIIQFFGMAALCWWFFILFNLHQIVVHSNMNENLEIRYHLISWGMGFITTVIPLSQDKFGPAGAWCWLHVQVGPLGTKTNNWDIFYWEFFLFYGEMGIVLIYGCYLCGSVIRRMMKVCIFFSVKLLKKRGVERKVQSFKKSFEIFL